MQYQLCQICRTILNALDNPVIVCNQSKEILFFNRFARNYLSFDKSVEGKNFFQFVCLESRKKLDRIFKNLPANHEAKEHEINIIHQDQIKALQVKIFYVHNIYLISARISDPFYEELQSQLIIANNEVTNLNRELSKKAIILERQNQEIRQLGFYDSLTGVYSRAFLNEEIKRINTSRQLPISVIMADLNGLKVINDTYGHSTGDKVIRKSAWVLKETCRDEDIIVRWGGDEFLILLPQTSEQDAKSICDRIIKKCSYTYLGEINISMSLGVSCKQSTEEDFEKVLKRADDNMYINKRIYYKNKKQ